MHRQDTVQVSYLLMMTFFAMVLDLSARIFDDIGPPVTPGTM